MKATSKFLIFIFIFFCSSKMHSVEYEKYADQIMNSFIDDVEKKYKINCCGSGGEMSYDVEKFMMGFTAYRPASIEEARELVVSLTEVFLSRVNAHEKIRPFLREYPFTSNRINIFISFEKKDGSSFSKDCISFVTHARDGIYYSKTDPLSKKDIDAYEEPYDEGLKIVKQISIENK